jgi:CubicO group peptidase (beta-lactamase class C family)
MRSTANAIALCLALAATTALADEARHAEIARRHAAPLVESGATPCVVVGILHEGRREHYAFGTFSEGDPRVPDADTLFEIGSITKVFTATLLAEGARRDELALDDPLSRHLPEGVDPPTFEGVEPTLAQLAEHTAGLPPLPANFGATTLADPYADYDEEKLWAYLDGLQLARKPGERYAYSNLGAGLLGTLVARAAGMSYADLIRERITGPLGMPDTVIELDDEQRARFAPPHSAGGRPSTNWRFQALAGAGALRSTASDLLTFSAVQLDPDDSPLGEAIRTTHQIRADPPDDPTYVALGWHVAGDRSTLVHAGGTNGYRSAIYVSPPLDLAVVVLTNATVEQTSHAAEKIVQSIAGMNPAPVEMRATADLTPEQLGRIAGAYVSPAFGRYEFRVEDGRLMAKLGPQPAFEVFATSETEFFYRAVQAELTFALDGEGRAVAVTLHQGGRDMRFERE